jgi:hypothetical protein
MTLSPILEAHGLTFFRFDDDSLLLREGELVGRATTSVCDCGTELGARNRRKLEQKVGSLRKKGWSDGRIERWRQETSRSASRVHTQDSTPAVAAWLGVLRQVAANRSTLPLGLLVRWSSDAVKAEIDYPIEDVDEIFLDELKRNALYRRG